MSVLVSWEEKEREYLRKALALVGEQNPAYNIIPVLELVRAADALGLEVTSRDENGLCSFKKRDAVSAEGGK